MAAALRASARSVAQALGGGASAPFLFLAPALCQRRTMGSAAEVVWSDGGNTRETKWTPQVGHGSGGRADRQSVRTPPEAIPFAVRGLSHVSIAVPDVAKCAEQFRTLLGARVSEVKELTDRGMAVASVHLGNTCLMFMQPLPTSRMGEGNPGLVQFLLQQPHGGVHHLSFNVDNLEGAMKHLDAEGVPLLRDEITGDAVHRGLRNDAVMCMDPGTMSGIMCEIGQVNST